MPDWVIALGGGSAMDAAKGMWVLYEHPEIDTLEKLVIAHAFGAIYHVPHGLANAIAPPYVLKAHTELAGNPN